MGVLGKLGIKIVDGIEKCRSGVKGFAILVSYLLGFHVY